MISCDKRSILLFEIFIHVSLYVCCTECIFSTLAYNPENMNRGNKKAWDVPVFLGHVTRILCVCRLMGTNSRYFWPLLQLGLNDGPGKDHQKPSV